MAQRQERNQEATVYVGDLDTLVTEALLWELMLQAGPVVNVYIPRDKLTQQHMGYGFVEFHSEEDADFASKIMNMIKLFGKPIRVNKACRERTLDVGANLFIGNLDPDVDEKLLYDTFSAFGVIISTPKIMRDPDTNLSKGFGFVSFANFEASDAAIEAMNGQYLCNRPINVSYALKKDSKGERHGSQAERLLAANNPNIVRGPQPHKMFATGPPMLPGYNPMPGMLRPPFPSMIRPPRPGMPGMPMIPGMGPMGYGVPLMPPMPPMHMPMQMQMQMPMPMPHGAIDYSQGAVPPPIPQPPLPAGVANQPMI